MCGYLRVNKSAVLLNERSFNYVFQATLGDNSLRNTGMRLSLFYCIK